MAHIMREPSLVLLTGAGISAESGIRTFRAADGLWENQRIEDVATPAAFTRDPQLVYQFYNQRRAQLHSTEVAPNAAHFALAELEALWPGHFLLVTQNVDDLHERAGSKKLLHMHGELRSALCQQCFTRHRWVRELGATDQCPSCAKPAGLRPDIVWFGEMPYHMEQIGPALHHCDIFVAIGTSGKVYPAAGFVREAIRAVRRIEVNLQASDISEAFDIHKVGPASREVPQLVQELLALHQK
jgi:NAD-dependent deacetylase